MLPSAIWSVLGSLSTLVALSYPSMWQAYATYAAPLCVCFAGWDCLTQAGAIISSVPCAVRTVAHKCMLRFYIVATHTHTLCICELCVLLLSSAQQHPKYATAFGHVWARLAASSFCQRLKPSQSQCQLSATPLPHPPPSSQTFAWCLEIGGAKRQKNWP